jgi:hypothetical protein
LRAGEGTVTVPETRLVATFIVMVALAVTVAFATGVAVAVPVAT